jgi:hypothetical protein
MKLRIIATLCLTYLTVCSAGSLQTGDLPQGQSVPGATIKQLIQLYVTTKDDVTKNEKVLTSIEAITAEESKQQTIRDKNNNDTTIKKWYCGTGLGAGILLIVTGTIMGIMHHVTSNSVTR